MLKHKNTAQFKATSLVSDESLSLSESKEFSSYCSIDDKLSEKRTSSRMLSLQLSQANPTSNPSLFKENHQKDVSISFKFVCHSNFNVFRNIRKCKVKKFLCCKKLKPASKSQRTLSSLILFSLGMKKIKLDLNNMHKLHKRFAKLERS